MGLFNRNKTDMYHGKQRDVFGQQVLERSRLEGKQSLTGSLVTGVFLGFIFALIVWIVVSLSEFGLYKAWPSNHRKLPADVTVGQIVKNKDGLNGFYNEDFKFITYESRSKAYDGTGNYVYLRIDENGTSDYTNTQYGSADDVPQPEWFLKKQNQALEAQENGTVATKIELRKKQQQFMYWVIEDRPQWKVFTSLLVWLVVFLWFFFTRWTHINRKNEKNDTVSLLQYEDDQHIQLPTEMMFNYHVIPDSGAHYSLTPSAILGHAYISFNTRVSPLAWVKYGIAKAIVGVFTTTFGEKVAKVLHIPVERIRYWGTLPKLKRVQKWKRYKKDTTVDGELFYKGDFVLDKDGNRILESVPIIDEKFGDALFEASNTPKQFRKRFNPFKLLYNPEGRNRDKLGKYKTIADLINDDWELPHYEVQTPAGVYIVDTAPVNVMVLAITRAGKGQTYIEPYLDALSRAKILDNIIVNDPKGELAVKFMVPFETRGYEVLLLNLINTMGTAIYNPLGLAADAAREGNMGATASYVNNIAETFFPLDGGSDPFWNQAANNAFKRAAFGLIDYFLEEERELVQKLKREGVKQSVLDQKIDELWTRVTLYNCYQLFTQLSSKKRKNPKSDLDVESDEFKKLSEEEQEAKQDYVAFMDKYIWEGKPELDLLSLYFNATAMLPRNRIRNEVLNTDATLKAMGGSDKTIASVYGIAITQMVFFTDPTIASLTSGAPSQNLDLGSLSFPRRISVKFDVDFLRKNSLIGLLGYWTAYKDPAMKEELGKEFKHMGLVSMDGWVEYMFEGIVPGESMYLKLELQIPSSEMVVKRFYFKFTKGYRTTPNGRQYVMSPIQHKKIVRNGTLEELRFDEDLQQYVPGYQFIEKDVVDVMMDDFGSFIPMTTSKPVPAIEMNRVRYTERPKAIFMITPPHLKGYAKLLLIFISQQTELNFEKAYLSKPNQKPLYKTNWMLDELGNLESEGNGIKNFMTYLSIGLGQDQRFTLILQVLQQLKDVYGESKDKIAQGNTSVIIFLKSTDDTSIDAVSKMSGTTHKVYMSSRTNNRDVFAGFSLDSGSISETTQAQEVPVLSYNDLAFINPANSVVLRAGDSPIWNRNETALPMAYKLQGDGHQIPSPGKSYSLPTLPTLSTTKDFDLLQNIPNFFEMVDKRLEQAYWTSTAKEFYMNELDLDDVSFMRQDQDVTSNGIMLLVNKFMECAQENNVDLKPKEFVNEDNMMQLLETEEYKKKAEKVTTKRFAKNADGTGGLSPDEIVLVEQGERLTNILAPGGVSQALNKAYNRCFDEVRDWVTQHKAGSEGFMMTDNGELFHNNTKIFDRVSLADMEDRIREDERRAFTQGGSMKDSKMGISDEDWASLRQTREFRITGDGAKFLAELKHWGFIAGGAFDKTVAKILVDG